MLDGNVLLRQERDEVPEGTLSCPYRTLADYHRYRHYEGLRLLPSTCDEIIIQQTLITNNNDETLSLCSHAAHGHSLLCPNNQVAKTQYATEDT